MTNSSLSSGSITDYFSSPINWCEDDFANSWLIVESYNSWSSLWISLAGIVGAYAYPNTRRLFTILIPLGLGSFYFHATLSLLGQLLDEGLILLVISASIHHLNNLHRIKVQRRAMIALELTIILVFIVAPQLNRFLLFGYGTTATLMVRGRLNNATPEVKELFDSACALFVAAIGCWILDQFCIQVLDILHLHALWHTIVAVASFALFIGIDAMVLQ